MITAIMQPTLLPWAGYFNLILKSQLFVFLDDAQFQKNSWHNRNQLIINGDKHWLTMPVNQDHLGKNICETTFKDLNFWKRKHQKMIRQNYSGHDYSNEINEFLQFYEELDAKNLAQLNIQIVQWISGKLGLEIVVFRASELGIEGERTERLVRILEHLKSKVYLSPEGARDYLDEDKFTEKTDVRLVFQDFTPSEYPQKNSTEFISHLSILDVVANIGFERTRVYIE